MNENLDNFSGNIYTYLKKRTWLFRYLLIINLIFGAWYLEWRINHSINFNALILSILLLLAEIYSYIGGVMFLIGLWRPLERKIKSLNQLNPTFPIHNYPQIDIFITCYNEPVDLVEKTAQAALLLDYPMTKLAIYILDDGNLPAMRAMTENLCLQDLKKEALQKEVNRINQERYVLQNQLKQLNNLIQVINDTDKYLHHFTLEVPTTGESLLKILNWFNDLKTSFVPEKVWIECETLLGEIFDNVLSHSHQNLPTETPIKIELNIYAYVIEIRVWDQGQNLFDLEDYLLKMTKNVDINQERGRGISMIINQIADYISYINDQEQGNCFLAWKIYTPLEESLHNQTDNSLYLASYLQGLKQLISLTHPSSTIKNLSDYLQQEIKKIENSLYQKEKEFSQLFRCRYIARPKPQGKPHHAKAGNINYAIFSGETTGELILTLDADHIPKPEFLQRVLPYFYQYNLFSGKYEFNDVAFVQTPQSFYNLSKEDPFCHQAHLFYGPIQQGKDGMNAAFYTGTNAILRREALVQVGLQNFAQDYSKDEEKLAEIELIGALSSESITEDMNTAMRLHAQGWKSVYHNEILAEGLAPDDLSSTLKQRLRWAQGTIQVLLRDNPFTKSGLSFWQQLQYFQTMYSYFSGFFVVIFISCPIIYFFTGIIPVQSYGADFAIHFIPAYVLNRLTFLVASWGISAKELWRSEQYAIALFPLFIQAVFSVFTGKPLKFEVTPKQRQSGIYLGLIIPQFTFFILTILGIIWCMYLWLNGNLNNPLIYLINSAWAIYNLALLWGIIRAALWQP